MGAEFGLADVPDVTHACVRLRPCGSGGAWLYPLALQVPGTQHILDIILKDGLERIPWWFRWESEAKAVCQWLHAKPRREFLQSRLAGFPDLVKSLDSCIDKFADWRWWTLANVTDGLIRTKAALIRATSVRQTWPRGMVRRRRCSLRMFNLRCSGSSAMHLRRWPGRLLRSRVVARLRMPRGREPRRLFKCDLSVERV